MNANESSPDLVRECGRELHDTYRIGKKLGSGSFSMVREAVHKPTGNRRSVKIISKASLKSDSENAFVQSEISLLHELDHPNIVKLHECFEDSKNYYIVTELCEGGELFEKVIDEGVFSESRAAEFMKEIFSVLSYLHKRNIVHRDIKPENIMLSSQSDSSLLKIIDFGTATKTNDSFLSDKQGSPYYVAPEVLEKRYSCPSDMWSAGICMYIFLCGYPPFDGSNEKIILKSVQRARFSFPSPEWDQISYEAKDLISKLLCKNPNERISPDSALRHPWLSHASKRPFQGPAASSLILNLHTFNSQRIIEKATIAYISTHLATNEETEELIELFKSLDTDDNGTLSRDELRIGYEKILGTEVEDIDIEVDRIMKEIDTDGSGEIDYSEFVAAAVNRQKTLTRERLVLAFNAFDVDGSGTISPMELKAMLGKFHKGDDHFWTELVREVDTNGDGEIDLDEFMAMMNNVI